MMGDHLRQLDAEADLAEAFACFDEEDKGWVDVGVVRKYLAEMGDRMDEAEVSAAWRATRQGEGVGSCGVIGVIWWGQGRAVG